MTRSPISHPAWRSQRRSRRAHEVRSLIYSLRWYGTCTTVCTNGRMFVIASLAESMRDYRNIVKKDCSIERKPSNRVQCDLHVQLPSEMLLLLFLVNPTYVCFI